MRLLTDIVGKRAGEGDDIQAHVNAMTEMFQKLLALGKFDPKFMLCATLSNSLPRSYDSLVLAIQSRREDEINIGAVKSIITEEYRRRSARKSGRNEDAALKVTTKVNVKPHQGSSSKLICHFCKKSGHFKRDCQKYDRWKADRGISGEKRHGANVVQQSNSGNEFLFLVGLNEGWILDSDATCHICCDRNEFTELNESHTEMITMANGEKVRALGRGKVKLLLVNGAGETSRVLMDGVLFVPSIGTKLISVRRITDKGFRVKNSQWSENDL